jgi:hypothetical protein
MIESYKNSTPTVPLTSASENGSLIARLLGMVIFPNVVHMMADASTQPFDQEFRSVFFDMWEKISSYEDLNVCFDEIQMVELNVSIIESY